jgi:hypothetical protein
MRRRSYFLRSYKVSRVLLVVGMLAAGLLLLFSCTAGGAGGMECVDFEDLTVGTMYIRFDVFEDSGWCIIVGLFQWDDGTWTEGNFTQVTTNGRAGGTGNEMQVNNVNLSFIFCTDLGGLTLKFGEYGGNLNIKINDDFRNFDNFNEIDGVKIGGVDVSVSGVGTGDGMGTLTLSGTINSFMIGGQELALDDVCPQD